MAKIVWVLGAGFSRSLGGPLITSLFTPNSRRQMQHFYPDRNYPLLWRPAVETAFRLYRHGLSDEIKAWTDPEDFLEKLDVAAQLGLDSSTWADLAGLVGDLGPSAVADLPVISIAARRILAAECSSFLKENHPNTNPERWEPYLTWAKQLTGNDTILTFNYDLVPDRLRQNGGKLYICLPRTPPNHLLGEAKVLKLHGSVNWGVTEQSGKSNLDIREDDFALTGDHKEIVIAGPGPQKSQTVDRLLSEIWEKAKEEIVQCDGIVFLGYRFPETDAGARRLFIDAIRKNDKVKFKATVVLGNSPAIQSVVEMLMRIVPHGPHAKPDRCVFPSSLYAETFLSCYHAEWFAADLAK